MRALVTGATGFIGSNLVRALLENGFEVKVLVRRGTDTRNIDGLGVKIALGDIRDRETVSRAMEGCDFLFHCAACYSFWVPSIGIIYDVNVRGTEVVLTIALEKGIKKGIYTSTASTIGVPRNSLGNEEMETELSQIVGHYKRSKYLAEQVAFSLCRQGLPLVIVNPTTPIGPRDIKPTPTGKIILDFLKRRMPAYVETGLNLIDVEDVAAGHLLALWKGKIGQRYILGHKNLFFKQMLDLLEEITGVKSPKVKIPHWLPLGCAYIDQFVEGRILKRPPAIPVEAVQMSKGFMFYDASKAVRELGLPQTPIEIALEKAVKWFRENGYA